MGRRGRPHPKNQRFPAGITDPSLKLRPAPKKCTLCYAIVLPGRKSAFRAGFWPDCYRESDRNRPSGRPEGRFGYFPGSGPAKIRPGKLICGPEALLRNTEHKRPLEFEVVLDSIEVFHGGVQKVFPSIVTWFWRLWRFSTKVHKRPVKAPRIDPGSVTSRQTLGSPLL